MIETKICVAGNRGSVVMEQYTVCQICNVLFHHYTASSILLSM